MAGLTRTLSALLLLTTSGCLVGADGEFDSLSGGTGGTGGTTTSGGTTAGDSADDGFEPDAQACDFEFGANPEGASACSIDSDCCAAELVPTGLVGNAACPGTEYPANWACESGTCRQRHSPTATEGCSTDADCVFEEYICATIGSVGHCVVPCLVDADCTNENNMPDSHCDGAGTYAFCMQDVP